jgi:tRNA pseudouridine55 synthase
MYSAVKIDGKTLMERARAGEVIEREARDIEIFSLSASKIADDEYNLLCSCSKGTYIRTLCADIGAALGCGGVMAKLTRTEACGIALSDTKTITELEEMNESDRMSLLIPAESIFNSLEKVKLPEFYTRLAKNGAEIYLSKIGCSISVRERVTLYTNNGEFFAIGEVREYKEGLAVKPIKFL